MIIVVKNNAKLKELVYDRLIELGYIFSDDYSRDTVIDWEIYSFVTRVKPDGFMWRQMQKSWRDNDGTYGQEVSIVDLLDETLTSQFKYERPTEFQSLTGHKVCIFKNGDVSFGCTKVTSDEVEKIIKLRSEKMKKC